jgi:hypothetical protein
MGSKKILIFVTPKDSFINDCGRWLHQGMGHKAAIRQSLENSASCPLHDIPVC